MANAASANKPRSPLKLAYEIFFCAFSLVNVVLVLFDFTYLMGVPYTNVTFRDIYLQKLPPVLDSIGVRPEYRTIVTDTYDPVKDILPHRGTDRYLTAVEFLKTVKQADEQVMSAFLTDLQNDPELSDDENDVRKDRRKTVARLLSAAGIDLPGFEDEDEIRADIQAEPAAVAADIVAIAAAVERKTLADLRERSVDMIDDSPFKIAGKQGTLELIKERIRDRIKQHLADDPDARAQVGGSAKDSFRYFWRSVEEGGDRALLTDENFAAEMEWFAERIAPLMQRNFYRHIGHDGNLVNEFYLIDRYFVLVFWLDFLVRWGIALWTRRYRKWYLFPVTHGFEVFNLLLPHHAAWLRLGRVLPLYMRLRENGFIPGEGILPGLVRDNATIIAEEISGLVLVRILAQVQVLMRNADLAAISQKGDAALIEVQSLLDAQSEVLVHGMMPVIQPRIADLVQHSIDKALEPWLLSPIGGVVRVAMIQVHKSVRDGLEAGLSSDEARDQIATIMKRSTDAIIGEMTEPDNLRELQQKLDKVMQSVIEDLEASLKKQEARENG